MNCETSPIGICAQLALQSLDFDMFESSVRLVFAYVHNDDPDIDVLYFRWYDPNSGKFGPIDPDTGNEEEITVRLSSSGQQVRITSAPSMAFTPAESSGLLYVFFSGKLGHRSRAVPMLFRLVLSTNFVVQSCDPILQNAPKYPVNGQYLATNASGIPTALLSSDDLGGSPVIFASSNSSPAQTVVFAPAFSSDNENGKDVPLRWDTSIVRSSKRDEEFHLSGPVAVAANTHKTYLVSVKGYSILIATLPLNDLPRAASDPTLTWPIYECELPNAYEIATTSVTPVCVPGSQTSQLYLLFQSAIDSTPPNLIPIISVPLRSNGQGVVDPGEIEMNDEGTAKLIEHGSRFEYYASTSSDFWSRFGSPVAAAFSNDQVYVANVLANNISHGDYAHHIVLTSFKTDPVTGQTKWSDWDFLGSVAANSCKPGLCVADNAFCNSS